MRCGLLILTSGLLWQTQLFSDLGVPGLTLLQHAVAQYVVAVHGGRESFRGRDQRREGNRTLGLLKRSDISFDGLLLGKSVPGMLTAMMILAVQIRFLLLSVTLGGVARRQILAAFLTLLACSVMLSMIALLWSLRCRTTRAAGSMVLLTLSCSTPDHPWDYCVARLSGWPDRSIEHNT